MRPERILPTKKCSVGCPVLDELVGGGIPCGSITELVGESGTGKTQLCLQLLLSAQLSVSLGGLSGSSLYIHSELPYPFRRFQQLSHAFRLKHPQFAHDPLDHVYVTYLQNARQLFDLLPHIHLLLSDPPSPLLLRFPVKLIVIDSIAALFRSEFDNTPDDLRTRSSLFFKISSKLKALAKQFGVAVFVTNQVVDFMDSSSEELRAGGNLACLHTSGRRVSPALGLSWANCVNSRLFLSKNEEQIASASSDNCVGCTRTKRLLHVIFAPHLSHSSCECVILNEGAFGVSPVLNL